MASDQKGRDEWARGKAILRELRRTDARRGVLTRPPRAREAILNEIVRVTEKYLVWLDQIRGELLAIERRDGT